MCFNFNLSHHVMPVFLNYNSEMLLMLSLASMCEDGLHDKDTFNILIVMYCVL